MFAGVASTSAAELKYTGRACSQYSIPVRGASGAHPPRLEAISHGIVIAASHFILHIPGLLAGLARPLLEAGRTVRAFLRPA
ncbi:hypothetical protein, partial [Achromobacter xylosoxidans]|uniref:hypothetical protein n=1 Tax=Alcaligenes xylosoxydans xylosoxydans TaxID=85698 RepID=UPI001F0FD1AB